MKGMVYLGVTAALIYVILKKLHDTKANLERDVSSRTAALVISEADLRKSEEHLKRLLASLPDVTHTSAPDGRITFVSPNIERLLGFTDQEVCQQEPEHWIERINPEDRDRVVKAYTDLFAEGKPLDEEYRLQHRLGHFVWVQDRVSRTKGVVDHADGILSDISQRKIAELQAKRYEEDLRKQQEKLNQSLTELGMALEAARAGTYDLDLTTGKIVWSDELRLVYGMQPGEFEGSLEDWAKCLVNEDRDSTLATLKANVEKGGGNAEFRIRRRDDGEVHWIEARGEVLYENNRPVRMIGVNTDITERKRAEADLRRLEEQFRHAQKMEAVGRLAGGMAHDFNNLLMVIRGYSEIVNERLPARDPARKHVTEVIKAADRAAALTSQLLAFSRKQVLSPTIFDLDVLVNETTKMLKRLIGEDVELRVENPGSLWNIKADRDQIVQVLMNLCVNARDAMPHGGVLHIELKNVVLTEKHQVLRPYLALGEFVELSIRDTGTGMTGDVQEHLFEPFFTTKELGKGTGLGLSTVYGIVKQSGGFIWVESLLGEGTTFRICLPKATQAATEIILPEETASQGRNETILVVEDEQGLREAICEYLQGLGYSILRAESGAEAMTRAGEFCGDISVMITDVVMPKMSGRELAEQLGRTRPSLRTIFMSGYVDDAILQHGLDDKRLFLQKPFKLVSLATKIQEVLRG
jgi:two-component system cell cycle sensor histidine kinase/response regulator CckA